MWISDTCELSYSVTNMLRKVYLTESFICSIESTQCPQFFFPVFLHTKNMTFHFQCNTQLKTGNWEQL